MDNIIRDLDNKILEYDFNGRSTDVACHNKIKMDYLLMLTIAATWDIKNASMEVAEKKNVMACIQRPETGKLIRLIDEKLSLHKSIVNIFDSYKEGRNLRFGHTTFDEYEAKRLNAECEQCWNELLDLPELDDRSSELIRKLYQEDNDFYFIASVKQNGDMLVKQFGKNNRVVRFSKITMKARLGNIENRINEGDLFILADDRYIKISPFIQFNDAEELFMMLMDIETSPLAFKMAYVYRTQYASDSVRYLEDFPLELKPYFQEELKKTGRNGIALNKFSQYELFTQDYYQGIHSDIQKQLNRFVTGNMSYGAVRGVGGVGKTSAVFMWMNRILNNKDGVLVEIRQKFCLRSIIFLSAKTKIYSREVNEENLTNFYEIESDVSNYKEIVEAIYSMFHPQEKEGTIFEDKVAYIRNYANKTHAVLIIIDDYESLPVKSRERIQQLKDDLDPGAVKMLITTRFTSKESKDIIVERLDEKSCAEMTDYIFESDKWRNDLSVQEMHELTGGLPLLIWYAKAYFKMGQLNSKRLKSNFSGPAEGLEAYLYDNFVQCFEDLFTRNFLMFALRYYKLHSMLQISKRIAVFLCLKEIKEYKAEDEEFYFQELIDLKLISINQSANSIDFSPLMIYMDKTSKRQEAKELYQEDALKVLTQLDERADKDLYAVLRSAEFLEDTIKYRIYKRIVDFTQEDEKIRNIAINRMFALTDDKLGLYSENEHIFQNQPLLIKIMMNYLTDNVAVIKNKYELIRDFLKSVSVAIEKIDDAEQIINKGIEILKVLLEQSLEEREGEKITNLELELRARFIYGLSLDFLGKISDGDKKEKHINSINTILDDVSTYCEIQKI